MKKYNYLMYKYYNVFILLIFVSFYSCDDNIIKNNNPVYSLVTNINGEVFDLPAGTKNIKATVQMDFTSFIIDSIIVDTSNFMFLNLDPPPPEFPYNIQQLFLPDTNIFISDRDANVNILHIFTFDTSNHFTGGLYKNNHISNPLNEGYFDVTYLYCDRLVRITGNSKTVDNLDTNFVM